MTKQDIVTAIENSPLVQQVHQIDESEISENLRLYQYHCLIGDETTANDEVVSFYVFDQGGANEKAWYRPNAQQSITVKPQSFTEVVTAKAEAFKDSGAIKAYKFTEVNDGYKWAIAKAWQTVNGADAFREYIAYENNAGALQFDPTGA